MVTSWEDLVYARISLEEHKANKRVRQEANVRNVVGLMRRGRLQWFAHISRREKEYDIKRVHMMRVKRKRNRGHPKHKWQEIMRKNIMFPQ